MRLLGKAFNLICLGLAALWTAICSLTTVLFLTFNEELGRKIPILWGKGWVKLMGINVTLSNPQNIPQNQAVVFAPNHESMFDILVFSSLPIKYRWVSKEQVGKIPLLGWALRRLGTYFVRRDQTGHDLNVMREIEEGLRSGHSVVIFPEGTRTRTGELLPFKKGAFRTAQNAGVPLCPVAISGTRAIASPGQLPSKRSHRVEVRFGSPYWIPKEMPISEAMEGFRSQLMALLKENQGH